MITLTITEAARKLGISRGRVVQLIAAGRIAAEQNKWGYWLIAEKELHRFAAIPRRVGRPSGPLKRR